MITAKELADAFGRNHNIMLAQTKGLSHADSILQPPIRGNCMNWVLGHIVDNRNSALRVLGKPLLLTEAQCRRYGFGSEPVCVDGEDVLKLDELLSILKSSHETIASALDRITPDELAEEIDGFYGRTSLGSFLFFLCWHETYHLGQTEILRQLAGTNDKVI